MNGTVKALTVFDDGGGPALFAGGYFTNAGGVTANRIAKWDGSSWTALGSGMNSAVLALTVFDDGSGPALYAGGGFTTAGGVAANRIAKWDGSSWSPLGSGIGGVTSRALTVFDDGGGPALFAGGAFTDRGRRGGGPDREVGRLELGAAWQRDHRHADFTSTISVQALAVFDDGNGPALWTGGSFTIAGGMVAKNIASGTARAGRRLAADWTPMSTP